MRKKPRIKDYQTDADPFNALAKSPIASSFMPSSMQMFFQFVNQASEIPGDGIANKKINKSIVRTQKLLHNLFGVGPQVQLS